MAYTYIQQKNIVGSARSFIGSLGAIIASGLSNDTDVSCEQYKLNYIFQLIDSICRFIPVGEADSIGHTIVLADQSITQDQATVLIDKLLNICPNNC